MKKEFALAISLIVFLQISVFSQEKIITLQNDLEVTSDGLPWINTETQKKGDAHSGNFFSSTTLNQPFGLGYKGSFPKATQNKNLHIRISEFLRTSNAAAEFLMVVSVASGDSTVFWTSFPVSQRVHKRDTWTFVSDSVNIPATFTHSNYSFAVYLWNKDGKATVDIDDLQLDFEEMKIPSFLVSGYNTKKSVSGFQKMKTAGKFSLYYNKEDGSINILSSQSDSLFNSLALVSEWFSADGSKKQSWSDHWYFRNDSLAEEGTFFHFYIRNEVSEFDLLILSGNDGQLSFHGKTIFNQGITLYRHTLAFSYTTPLTEVFRKSTLSDTTNFKDEYWLGTEGFKLGNTRGSWIIYHPDNLSSIQLDRRNSVAYFNLDYALDHPLLHYPLMKESKGKFVDHSCSFYHKGDQLNASFTIHSGIRDAIIPRILNNPNGFLSSFVWTEHADYSSLRLHRAVYFGSENIKRADQSTGGFVRYSIPVTKSYFYANPDSVNNREKAGFLPGPESSYKDDPEFRSYLKELYENGYEICLHTPDHYTSNRQLLEEALTVNRREFFSPTWIDHGYDNSARSNREDLVCDGTDSTSQWYAADLWKQYGIKYLWNSFYEDTSIFTGYGFNSFFSFPYSGWGEAFPVPGHWRNKTRTGDLVHWGTMSTWDPPEASFWQYFFNDQRLTDLVNNRSDVIMHAYPARVDSASGYYEFINGAAVATGPFNDALRKLSDYRAQKKIWITTIQQMLDYRMMLEKVSISVLADGRVLVKNNGLNRIAGLTLSAHANEALIEGNRTESKIINGELIFWFDLEPSAQIILTLKK